MPCLRRPLWVPVRVKSHDETWRMQVMVWLMAGSLCEPTTSFPPCLSLRLQVRNDRFCPRVRDDPEDKSGLAQSTDWHRDKVDRNQRPVVVSAQGFEASYRAVWKMNCR